MTLSLQRDVVDAVRVADKVGGWMARDELAYLAEAARALPVGGTWVELGTWRGRSFAAVALSVPPGSRVVAVDTWQGSPGEAAHEGGEVERAATAFNDTFRLLEDMRPDVELAVMQTFSVEAARYYADATLGAVFLDAAHDYDNVLADLRAWMPKVKPGGLLAGHDLHPMWPGVERALHAASVRYSRAAGTLWVRE